MRRSSRPLVFSLAIALAGSGALAAAAAAGAPPDDPKPAAVQQSTSQAPATSGLDTGDDPIQHGGGEGHLPPTRNNVEVVGKAAVSNRAEGRVADVDVYGNHAYLASYVGPDCRRGGVYIFDISNVRAPKEVGFVPTGPSSFVGEGVQVKNLQTRNFDGRVLIFNNEICDTPVAGTVGGATLVDVTNPRQPEVLAEGFGDFDPPGAGGEGIAHQVHSAFVWQDGRKAFAVLVDDEEAADVDIFNITDPSNPRKIAEHNLAELFPQTLQPAIPNLTEVFLHDMIVKEIDGRQVMLASYWDAGYIKLDVSNPRDPVYLGDTDFTDPDPELLAQTGQRERPEGNGHQAEFTKGNRYVLGADEDFAPFGLIGETDDGLTFDATLGSDTPPITSEEPLTGTTVFVGRACNADPAVPAPPASDGPYVAVAERGACTFSEKVANIESVTTNGGYVGTVIFNSAGAGNCGAFGMSVDGDRPAVSVNRRTGFELFDVEYDEEACQSAAPGEPAPIELGAVGDDVTIRAFFDGWGYVHLFDNRAGKMVELDTFAVPEAMDDRYASRFGALSVHEVATSKQRPDLVYVAYYSAGFRVLKIQAGRIRPVGRFIAPRGNDFWGAEVFRRNGQEFVAASDRDFGLYIMKYTGRP